MTPDPVTVTQFNDPSSELNAVYMVRAIKLESTTSGSYYNASQGTFWTAENLGAPVTIAPPPTSVPESVVASVPSSASESAAPAIIPAALLPDVQTSETPAVDTSGVSSDRSDI